MDIFRCSISLKFTKDNRCSQQRNVLLTCRICENNNKHHVYTCRTTTSMNIIIV